MEPSHAPSASSRKRHWLFVIGAVPLLLLNIVLHPPAGGVSGRGTGFLLGYLFGGAIVLLFIIALVYGIARLVRRHKTPPAVAAVAFWTLLALAGLDFLSAIGGRKSTSSATPLTSDERAGLRIEADSIRHPSLGFSLPNPGPTFAPAPEIQTRLDSGLSEHPDMAGWVLQSKNPPANVIIQLVRFPFMDEGRFRAFVTELRDAASHAKDPSILTDTVLWQPPSGDYRLTLHYPAGQFLQTRCISRSRPDGYFILCVQTAGVDSSALAFVRDGLSMRR